MNARVIAVGLAALAMVTAGIVWFRGRSEGLSGRGSASLTTGNPYALPESLVGVRPDTPGGVAMIDPARVDSTPMPHPPSMVGTWHHGDGRSQYGDSLVLVLRDDGTATANERHYMLDKTGWHVARLQRAGTWEIRYRGNRLPQLCTRWESPQELDACAPVRVSADSLVDQPMMEFAGRHWRKGADRSAGAATPGRTRAGS